MIAVSTRRRKQRGNTVLESALCFLPMMAMFFGIIDVCYAVSIQSLFSQAVRAGSRWGITYSGTYGTTQCGAISGGTTGPGSQSACIAQVVEDNSVGFLSSSNAANIVINYYVPNNLSTPVMVCSNGTCTPSTTVTLPDTYTVTTVSGNSTSTTSVTIKYANSPGNIVEVTIPAFPLLWMIPINGYTGGATVTDAQNHTGPGLVISAFAFDVLGGLAEGTVIPPAP